MSSISRLRGRVVAIAGVVALGAGAVAVALPSATAAPQPVTTTSSKLSWGVKQSFRTYITNIAAGSITVSEGATKTSSGFDWPSTGGTYDAATKVGQLDYQGKVVFRSVAHTIWDITLSNPTVVLDGDSTGTLLVDVSYHTGGTEAAPENQGSATDVNFGQITVGTPTTSGTVTTFANQAVTLTAEGAASFNGFYEAGTAMDPLTALVNQQPSTPTPTPTPTPTNPPAANPVGDAVSALVASLTATLNALLAGLGGR